MADEKKYIDAMPLIAEYDKSIQWLKDNAKRMSWNQFSDQMASMQSARKILIDAPAADVRSVVRGMPVKFYNDSWTGRMITTCSVCDGRISPKDHFLQALRRGYAGDG